MNKNTPTKPVQKRGRKPKAQDASDFCRAARSTLNCMEFTAGLKHRSQLRSGCRSGHRSGQVAGEVRSIGRIFFCHGD